MRQPELGESPATAAALPAARWEIANVAALRVERGTEDVDQRSDCKQVCIGLVCSSEGLPLSFEVFAGNRNDVSTVEQIVTDMERKYGQANRVWVMD